MSDELNQPSSLPPNTQSTEPPVESPVDPPKLPPVLPPLPSKEKGSWLPAVIITLLLIAGIATLGFTIIFAIAPGWVGQVLLVVIGEMENGWQAFLKAVERDGWEWVWKVTLIGTSGLFGLLSVLVIVGGALDVRKLFRRLREREASGESDSAD